MCGFAVVEAGSSRRQLVIIFQLFCRNSVDCALKGEEYFLLTHPLLRTRKLIPTNVKVIRRTHFYR